VTGPRPYTVRVAGGVAMSLGAVLLFASLFNGPNVGAFAFGALFVSGGLLLRIEAAILQITDRRPPPDPDTPSRPWRRDPDDDAGSDPPTTTTPQVS